MQLVDELERIAAAARSHAAPSEDLAVVIPAEPVHGVLVYLCAFESPAGRSWIGLDVEGAPVIDRGLVHDAVTIAALCELAEESAAGGDIDELRGRLDELVRCEGAESSGGVSAALTELEAALAEPPRLASPAYLDRIGLAARRLEQAFGETGASPFAQALKQGAIAVEGLTVEVESTYKLPLG